MKNAKYIFVPFVISVIFVIFSCKKDELELQKLEISSETVVKGITSAQITVNYRYPTSLKQVDGYVSIMSSMTVANKATAAIDGKTFVVNFQNLEANTTYYYQFEYSNGVDEIFTEVKSFTTKGAIAGVFSVGSTKKVRFSKGNLQYQATKNTWRFAENQYDYIGSDNSNISSSYNGWIDLFGWGTSGYNHGAVCYQPWSTSTTSSDYYAYGSYTYNLNDQNGKADWGYNAISNGGNTTNTWYTLTRDEWVYVFNTRSTASGIKYAKAQVNGINGVILLPDDWNTSTYSLNSTNTTGASYTTNTMTAENWSILEDAGAVFMPAAGYRSGTNVYHVGSYGGYWSASYYDSDRARGVWFIDDGLKPDNNGYGRRGGLSVRLVCTAEN